MPLAFSRSSYYGFLLSLLIALSSAAGAEPVPLKRIVELALSHSTTAAEADAAAQRAYAAYHETRDLYLPALTLGSGLG